jgi:hypothetical protein
MDDVAYFRRRADDELIAARSTACSKARAIHQELSLRYLEMAEAITAHNAILQVNWAVEMDREPQATEA